MPYLPSAWITDGQHHHVWLLCGAGDHTQGLIHTNQALCQLSYIHPQLYPQLHPSPATPIPSYILNYIHPQLHS